jgi:hypothetical protein
MTGVIADPTMAHSGSHALLIGADHACDLVTGEFWIVVPSPDAGGGPAAVFWYRSTPSVNYEFSYYGTTTTNGVQDGAWHRAVMCLPPRFAGRKELLWLRMQQSTAIMCGTAIPLETTIIDDLDATTDPSCPSS